MKTAAALCLGAAGLTAGAAGLALGITDQMIRAAVDREKPLLVQLEERRGRGPDPAGPYTRQIKEQAAVLKAQPNETVTITARDGIALAGHWMPRPEAKRILIAMHGWRSVWYNDFGMSYPFYRDEGCSILYAEQRGMNASGGDHITFGLMERFDCLDWAAWAHARCPELPVYLAGISLGGATVLLAAGETHEPWIHGVMDDCGFTTPQAILHHVAREYFHLSGPVIETLADWRFRRLTGLAADGASALDAMARCTVPVLFVHGQEDRFVPTEMTRRAYAACQAPKRLLIVPGAGHGLSYLVDTAGYQEFVRAFWRDFD